MTEVPEVGSILGIFLFLSRPAKRRMPIDRLQEPSCKRRTAPDTGIFDVDAARVNKKVVMGAPAGPWPAAMAGMDGISHLQNGDPCRSCGILHLPDAPETASIAILHAAAGPGRMREFT